MAGGRPSGSVPANGFCAARRDRAMLRRADTARDGGGSNAPRHRAAAGGPAVPRPVRFRRRRQFHPDGAICRRWSPIFRTCGGTAAFRSARCSVGAAFAGLAAELEGDALRHAIEREICDRSRRSADDDHGARPERRQGRPHPHRFGDQADHPAALYEPGVGGRRAAGCGCCAAPTTLGDYVAEIAPLAGTMVAFRRSAASFHGHHPHRASGGRCSSIG